MRVAVFGASGMVGRHVCRALDDRGVEVVKLAAPRIAADRAHAPRDFVPDDTEIAGVATALQGVDAVINCAGKADAGSADERELIAANALTPAVIAAGCRAAGVSRFVHVSSAAVQGRRHILDDTDSFADFSPFSSSKVLGEQIIRRFGPGETVAYRPPSVQEATRPQTQQLVRVASSAFSSVASPGTDNTAQALAENVGDAAAFLAITDQVPPRTVIHPSEGLTTAGFLELIGGRRPLQVPRWFARFLVVLAELVGRLSPRVAAIARRVEMLWFGQRQDVSWLSTVGWAAPYGTEDWRALSRDVTATSGVVA